MTHILGLGHVARIVLGAHPGAHIALATVGVHDTEGLAGNEGDGADDVGQVALQVLPTDPVDTALGAILDLIALGREVLGLDGAVAVSAPQAQPQVGGAFRCVDPHAHSSGAAVDLDILRKAQASAFDAGDIPEVVVQPQCLFAKAHLAVVHAADLCGTDGAAVLIMYHDDIAVVIFMVS